MTTAEKIERLPGPILILGGSGFIGANLFRTLLKFRRDVYGTTSAFPAWRLDGVPEDRVVKTDLLVDANIDALLARVEPRTIFNCAVYGGHSFETDSRLIHETNFNFVSKLLNRLESRKGVRLIQAGSSSEYGDNSAGPAEDSALLPNSDYSVSKAASAGLVSYFGRKKAVPCANLRLYSVYGPLEDSSRLIPALVQFGSRGEYPPLVDPEISRDYVYIDDACEAFIDAALALREKDYGESFNIGSGRKTTIREAAAVAGELFGIGGSPVYGTMANRNWDLKEWFADAGKARQRLGWQARTDFRAGLELTARWYRGLEDKDGYQRSSKKYALDTTNSVSAIVACYEDAQAIPIMHQRLTATFAKLKIDHEIIFVNDASPDDSEEVIRAISKTDRRVTGITHSRNFGSQECFRSGMELAGKNACVLLDGDLQDPPELIEQFVQKWREGYDVVYGRRVKREATLFMQLAYKLFYRVFDYFSYVRIPHDAGDFSLLDRNVVRWVLRFPERDLFLRGVRAFVGFKQTGVDYLRPKRLFGESTNSFINNINWAKKGILSFSNTPLNMLSFSGTVLFFAALALAAIQTLGRLLYPERTPHGITTILLAILFFGSINLLAVAIVGEYIAKIFEEVKRRPHYIRRGIIREGEVRFAAEPSSSSAD
ncbi:MAG: NAD-dependent epimerase/dehydratase family protein [Elusimicrobiota bacterium]